MHVTVSLGRLLEVGTCAALLPQPRPASTTIPAPPKRNAFHHRRAPCRYARQRGGAAKSASSSHKCSAAAERIAPVRAVTISCYVESSLEQARRPQGPTRQSAGARGQSHPLKYKVHQGQALTMASSAGEWQCAFSLCRSRMKSWPGIPLAQGLLSSAPPPQAQLVSRVKRHCRLGLCLGALCT